MDVYMSGCVHMCIFECVYEGCVHICIFECVYEDVKAWAKN